MAAKFLFVTMPVTGHVSPLLPLAKKLVERNHEVRWYTSARFQHRIEDTGATFLPYLTANDIDYGKVNELFPERTQLKGIAQAKYDMKRLIVDISFEQCPDINNILDDYSADMIVGDTFAFGAQFIAEARGLLYTLINITNMGFPSRDIAPDGLGLAPSNTPFGRLRNRFLNWLLARILLRDVNNYFMEARAKLGLPSISESIFAAPIRADLFLQPTIPAFEYPRSDLPDHVHFIGALLPNGASDFTKPGWWNELGNRRPVVLVTQGTVATNADELLLPAIQGLADEDVLVIATTGNKSPNRLKQISLPANVHLEQFIPFAQLMPHVDVMVTNGGYGGTHFALTHGVPLVAAGTSEDKAEICARIAWSGVGINQKTQSPTLGQIRDAVKEILNNPQYKRKAEILCRDFANHDAAMEAAELMEMTLTLYNGEASR